MRNSEEIAGLQVLGYFIPRGSIAIHSFTNDGAPRKRHTGLAATRLGRHRTQ